MNRTGRLQRAQDREQRLGLGDGRAQVALAVLDQQRRADLGRASEIGEIES